MCTIYRLLDFALGLALNIWNFQVALCRAKYKPQGMTASDISTEQTKIGLCKWPHPLPIHERLQPRVGFDNQNYQCSQNTTQKLNKTVKLCSVVCTGSLISQNNKIYANSPIQPFMGLERETDAERVPSSRLLALDGWNEMSSLLSKTNRIIIKTFQLCV